jgi:hypothetical protein
MMNILAHRGMWRQPAERNQPEALRQALMHGFGIETDVRDAANQLVISHDPPTGSAQPLAELLAQYCSLKSTAALAINIKADGLRSRLKSLLEANGITNYFCFDMSLPEMLAFQRDGLRFFTRASEYEPEPLLYEHAAGIWMDLFESDWIMPEHIRAHLDAGKQVALVSPELHHRAHEDYWIRLRNAGLAGHPEVMLCTDLPASARTFFYE